MDDPLRVLEVIDRLEVGPVRVEPNRLVAPYVVRQAGRVDSAELAYKYEEPVFDPADSGARNLAAMVAAQVALNYGLFCRQIIFRGPYDAHDRRFIEEMARNTAREIYVNKLLLPNPFLVGPVAELPRVKLADYLRAELVFDPEKLPAAATPPWETNRDRHAVLSSGGKDSLLTYGLLAEMGRETHPIYVNESGRHWYTALNAHRYFREHVPNTARVWTSADRLFAWMLRQLPFVRGDFANLRSDEYPIRLWTVAVFLFGALPLLRKRGVGRLLIGDEFDTSVRPTHGGIPHYAGLYDQSRYFDGAMSKYFARKRWGVAQFSVLRPLSELLIEKTLVERYPDLQTLQVSCHATHVDGDRVKPCGRCEKCRRIVGMLVALGADPTRCGYDAAQVKGVIDSLSDLGVHQESEGVEHLFHLLVEGGHIPASALRSGVRPRPEVMQLRFARQRSPVDDVPKDLREPLYRILLEHAEGAVWKSGRVWAEHDPLSPDALAAPFRFERGEPPKATDEPTGAADYVWGELTWPDAEVRLSEVDVALLPVGAVEQHGPHLPLDVDAFDADRLCRDVAARCGTPRPLVLPLIPYGVSYHHDDFAGTISVSPGTLAELVREVGMCVARQGITKLVIVNGHGGNGSALHFAAQTINRDARIFTCVDSGETSDAEVEALAKTPNDVHAGEIETSTALHLRPELVKMDLARKAVPHFSSDYLEFSSKKGVGWHARTARISPSGVLGDPTRASRELGERIWDVMVRNLVELVEDLKSMTLDEIHQRRY